MACKLTRLNQVLEPHAISLICSNNQPTKNEKLGDNKMKKLSATLIFLLFSINLHAQILMSDDFEGPIIDPAKWLVWEGYRGGIVEQEDGKIVWKHLDAITPGTGHGIQTVDAFQDGGIYVIEGDYESNEPNFCLQMGEGGTGISITSISPERENYYYGYPTPSITVYLHGNISYTYGPQASQGYYIHDYNRIFENEIYKTECEILHGNDIFYFYKKQIPYYLLFTTYSIFIKSK